MSTLPTATAVFVRTLGVELAARLPCGCLGSFGYFACRRCRAGGPGAPV